MLRLWYELQTEKQQMMVARVEFAKYLNEDK